MYHPFIYSMSCVSIVCIAITLPCMFCLLDRLDHSAYVLNFVTCCSRFRSGQCLGFAR